MVHWVGYLITSNQKRFDHPDILPRHSRPLLGSACLHFITIQVQMLLVKDFLHFISLQCPSLIVQPQSSHPLSVRLLTSLSYHPAEVLIHRLDL